MKTQQILYRFLYLLPLLLAIYSPSFAANCLQGSPDNITECQQQLINRLRSHPGIQIVTVGDTIRIILGVDKFFQHQSSTRIYAYQEPVLDDIAQLLLTYGPNRRIVISGHTDNVGSDESKVKRSRTQADTIAGYLWSGGVSLGNTSILACADTEPVASNKTVVGSAANRRVEIEPSLTANPRYFK